MSKKEDRIGGDVVLQRQSDSRGALLGMVRSRPGEEIIDRRVKQGDPPRECPARQRSPLCQCAVHRARRPPECARCREHRFPEACTCAASASPSPRVRCRRKSARAHHRRGRGRRTGLPDTPRRGGRECRVAPCFGHEPSSWSHRGSGGEGCLCARAKKSGDRGFSALADLRRGRPARGVSSRRCADGR